MSRWYRRYTGTVSDPKIAEAALVAECSKAVVIATWDMILESAAETNESGQFRATSRNVAATLGEQIATIERVFSALESLEMIENGIVLAWSRRQFQSDSSTERSRKHRALRNGNGGATPMQRCATPPDTETDTDSETKKDDVGDGASTEGKIKFLPDGYLDRLTECATRVLADPVNAIGLTDPSVPLMWLREGCDFDLDVIPAVTKVSKSRRVKNVHNWNYFSQAVSNAKAARLQGLPPAAAERPTPSSERNTVARDLRALIRSGEFNVQSAS